MGSAELRESGRPDFFDNYWKRSCLCGQVGEDAVG